MKTTLPLFLVLFVLCSSTTASGETTAALGLNIWGNTWYETVSHRGGGSDNFRNGSAILAGPDLVIRTQNRWFVDTYYLFPLNKYESSDWLAPGDKMEFSESEFDIRVGREFTFFLLHSVTLAPFFEYKRIDARASYTNPSAGLVDVDMGTWRMSGEGIGLFAKKSFHGGTEIYTSLAFLAMRQEFAFTNGVNSGSFSTSGTVFDIGVKQAFSKKFTTNLGLKVQQFFGTLSTGDNDKNTFAGISAGVMYAF
jgi:hypothetical protein